MASLPSDDDQARFASVVLPHLADAYALARWLTGDRADAEDVVQEACLRAFRGIGGFCRGNAPGWRPALVRRAGRTPPGEEPPAAAVPAAHLRAAPRRGG